MARRDKLKKVSLAPVAIDESPLDVRPNVVANRKTVTIDVIIDNPNYDPLGSPEQRAAPKKILTKQNAGDPLYIMYKQGVIDDPQKLAGERWRECCQLCQIGGVRGQDMAREYVDTSHRAAYEPVGDKQIKARKDLKKAQQNLGVVGEFVVNRILGECMFPRQVAELMGDTTDRKIRYWTDRFKEALQTLAVSFTYCS